MDLREYWKTLAQEAGISAEENEKVLKALSDAKNVESFNKEFVPRSTFSSQLDRQRDDLRKLYEDNYKQWYDRDVTPEISKRDQALAKAQAKLQAFETTYGRLDDATETTDPSVVRTGSGDYISRKDFEAMMDQRDKTFAERTARVLKDVVKSSQDHMKRFGEPLDVDAWEKFAVENNLPPDQAYAKFIEPRAKEFEEKALNARITREREEAVKDYASRNKLPIDTKPREISPLALSMKQDKEKVPRNDREKFELFQEAMREVEAEEASTH
jgi:hypothetical protein